MSSLFRTRLQSIDQWLQGPMLWLSFAWLLILIDELVRGFTPALFLLGSFIWIAFIIQFALRLFLSPQRGAFLKENWAFLLALVVPTLRVVQLQEQIPWLGYLTATSGVQVVWVFCSLNWDVHNLRKSMDRRGLPFAISLTLMVVFVGAAGLYHFESPLHNPGMNSYLEALWWTAMQMTTISSGYNPSTAGGQVIALGISIFACGVFGYLTAILATFFVGQDAANPQTDIAGQQSLDLILTEVRSLRAEVDGLKQRLKD